MKKKKRKKIPGDPAAMSLIARNGAGAGPHKDPKAYTRKPKHRKRDPDLKE